MLFRSKLWVGLAQDQCPVMRDMHLPQRFNCLLYTSLAGIQHHAVAKLAVVQTQFAVLVRALIVPVHHLSLIHIARGCSSPRSRPRWTLWCSSPAPSLCRGCGFHTLTARSVLFIPSPPVPPAAAAPRRTPVSYTHLPAGFGYIDVMKDCQNAIDKMNHAMDENVLLASRQRYVLSLIHISRPE